jgi:hypothetical protein
VLPAIGSAKRNTTLTAHRKNSENPAMVKKVTEFFVVASKA